MITAIHTDHLLAATAAVAINRLRRPTVRRAVRSARAQARRERTARLLRGLADGLDSNGAPRVSQVVGA